MIAMKKKYFLLINLVMIGLVMYIGVNAFFKFKTFDVQQPLPKQVSPSKDVSHDKEVVKPISAYSGIIDRNLFKTKTKGGKVPSKPDPGKIDKNIEETNLPLKLWGTTTGLGDRNRAVIEDTRKRTQNLYKTGESVQNAIVKMILREKVILSVDGKDQLLEIEKAESGKGGKKDLRRGGRTPRRQSRARRTQKITLRRSRIDNAIEDVSKLMTQVNVRPHFNQGQPDGLMLTRIKPRSLFREMGLRNGDVITGINGENVESVDATLKLYDLLKSNSSVSLQLKRRGRNRTIEYTVR